MVAHSGGALTLLHAPPLQGHPRFTERDWLFLFGQPRQEVFSRRLLLRFTALWLAVVIVSFAIAVYLALRSRLVCWRILLSIGGILLIVPKWLR
jgi:hypothetical protein